MSKNNKEIITKNKRKYEFKIDVCKTCIIASCCNELCEKSVTEIIANPEFKKGIKEI